LESQYGTLKTQIRPPSMLFCTEFVMLSAFARLQKPTVSFRMSVRPYFRPHRTPQFPSGRIFIKFDIWVCFEHISWKYTFLWHMTRKTGSSHEELFTFAMVSCWIFLRTKNVSNKSCRENQNTHFVCAMRFFFPKSCPLWYNVEKLWWRLTFHRWQENTAHVLCTLEKWGYRLIQNV